MKKDNHQSFATSLGQGITKKGVGIFYFQQAWVWPYPQLFLSSVRDRRNDCHGPYECVAAIDFFETRFFFEKKRIVIVYWETPCFYCR